MNVPLGDIVQPRNTFPACQSVSPHCRASPAPRPGSKVPPHASSGPASPPAMSLMTALVAWPGLVSLPHTLSWGSPRFGRQARPHAPHSGPGFQPAAASALGSGCLPQPQPLRTGHQSMQSPGWAPCPQPAWKAGEADPSPQRERGEPRGARSPSGESRSNSTSLAAMPDELRAGHQALEGPRVTAAWPGGLGSRALTLAAGDRGRPHLQGPAEARGIAQGGRDLHTALTGPTSHCSNTIAQHTGLQERASRNTDRSQQRLEVPGGVQDPALETVDEIGRAHV